jgi:hypothetical protein
VRRDASRRDASNSRTAEKECLLGNSADIKREPGHDYPALYDYH